MRRASFSQGAGRRLVGGALQDSGWGLAPGSQPSRCPEQLWTCLLSWWACSCCARAVPLLSAALRAPRP